MNTPLVSIIMATYNRAHLITETLDSIANQSFENWECLIIDDGSTDGTKEILEPYLKKEPRFQLYSRTSKHKKGLPGARNMGIEMAKGKYVIFFDDDDIVHPDNLQICVNVLSHEDHDFCRYDKLSFSEEFTPSLIENSPDYNSFTVGKENIDEMITGKLPFASCTVMWKKECLDNHKFNEELLYAEEWECYSRILSSEYKGVSINAILYFNRKHPTSNTGEFYNNDPVRRDSYVEAIKLVVENLYQKDLLTEALNKYFLRLGFFLRNESVVKNVLKYCGYNKYLILKYRLGFKFYPVLRPIFIFKSKLKKN